MTVKKSAKKWACVLGSAVFAVGAGRVANAATRTGDAATPYDSIGVRNVFDLREFVISEPTRIDTVLPRVYLTGITTILGMKQAYFVVQAPAVPGKPAVPDKYMTLAEGQWQEMLKVLEIDPGTKMVKINNSGSISTITFETNRIAISGKLDMVVTGNSHAVGATPGLSSVSVRNQSSGPGVHASAPQMDPEQQIVLMELQREASKSQVGSGQLPPLPPTPLSEVLQQEQQQQQSGTLPVGRPTPNFPGQHNTLR